MSAAEQLQELLKADPALGVHVQLGEHLLHHLHQTTICFYNRIRSAGYAITLAVLQKNLLITSNLQLNVIFTLEITDIF